MTPFVLVNPVGGHSDPAALRELLTEQFGADGYVLQATQADEPFQATIEAALDAGHTLIVAAGGDGTVHAVGEALVNAGRGVLGIVPLGTSNVLARALGIPLDPAMAVALLGGDHRERTIDVMRCAGRIFVSHIAIGLYSDAVLETDRADKQQLGRAAYVATGLKMLANTEVADFRFEIDGAPHQVSGSLLLIANTGETGVSVLQFGQAIEPDDGVFDVLIVSAVNVAGYAEAIVDALRGRQDQSEVLDSYRATRQVVVENAAGRAVMGDGEAIGNEAISVDLLPKRLPVCVPLNDNPDGATG